MRYHWQLAGLLNEPPSNLRFLSLKIQLWKSIKWSGFAMIVLWCSGYAITNLVLTDLESFSLCIVQYDSKDQQNKIFIKGEKCYTQLYMFIHVYTFCCSSYTCITSFLFELYMYNFILLFELYMYNFISVWVIHV